MSKCRKLVIYTNCKNFIMIRKVIVTEISCSLEDILWPKGKMDGVLRYLMTFFVFVSFSLIIGCFFFEV